MKIYKNAKLLDLIKKVDGWLTHKEGLFLYTLAKDNPLDGDIIEIGSWKGKSTICLSLGAKESSKNNKVYAIDPHTGSNEHKEYLGENIWTYEEFLNNIKMANIDDVVIPLVKTSEQAKLE
ncbi:hypothetical protein GMMP15_1490018 [Candidatus Magnetomoraceae bacterium gMMP-15]